MLPKPKPSTTEAPVDHYSICSEGPVSDDNLRANYSRGCSNPEANAITRSASMVDYTRALQFGPLASAKFGVKIDDIVVEAVERNLTADNDVEAGKNRTKECTPLKSIILMQNWAEEDMAKPITPVVDDSAAYTVEHIAGDLVRSCFSGGLKESASRRKLLFSLSEALENARVFSCHRVSQILPSTPGLFQRKLRSRNSQTTEPSYYEVYPRLSDPPIESFQSFRTPT